MIERRREKEGEKDEGKKRWGGGSVTFLNMGAAVVATTAPVAVPPVKLMAATSGCSTIALPTDAPKPCTMFSTPEGT